MFLGFGVTSMIDRNLCLVLGVGIIQCPSYRIFSYGFFVFPQIIVQNRVLELGPAFLKNKHLAKIIEKLFYVKQKNVIQVYRFQRQTTFRGTIIYGNKTSSPLAAAPNGVFKEHLSCLFLSRSNAPVLGLIIFNFKTEQDIRK